MSKYPFDAAGMGGPASIPHRGRIWRQRIPIVGSAVPIRMAITSYNAWYLHIYIVRMSPAQLRAFYAVAASGSFTAAARMLNVSQPPVTTHVRELEELYGVELFHRHGRGAELTEVGRNLLAIAQRVMANQQDAVDFLKEVGNLQTGRLRLGAVGAFQLTEILALFCGRYPKIGISVTQGNSRTLLDDLRAYRSDIAVVGQVGHLEEFDAILYSQPEIVIIVHRDHPWSHRKEVGIRELEAQPMIFREEGSETRRVLEQATGEAGVKLRCAMQFDSREGVVAAVARGLGIGALPDEQFVDLKMLRKVRVHDAGMHTDVHVLCLRERRDSRLIRAFMDMTLQLVKASPGRPSKGATSAMEPTVD